MTGAPSRHGNRSTGWKPESKFIYDAIASASIVHNGAGVETARSRVLTLNVLANFMKTQQGERKSEMEVKAIIEVSEWNIFMCNHNGRVISVWEIVMAQRNKCQVAGPNVFPSALGRLEFN